MPARDCEGQRIQRSGVKALWSRTIANAILFARRAIAQAMIPAGFPPA